MEPNPKKLWFKDVETLKTFVVIVTGTMTVISTLLVFWGALFG